MTAAPVRTPCRVQVVTTMNAAGYSLTGDRMMASAGTYWRPGVRLRCYAEGFAPDGLHPFVEWRELKAEADWLAGFKADCAALPERCGIVAGAYDFRRDARKFCHKVAALTAAGLELAAHARDRRSLPELLVWMDADTVTHAEVTADWLCDLLPPRALLGWLDRTYSYPECGFLAFRPGHPEFGRLMLAIRDAYARGGLWALPEWHDSYVIQQVVRPFALAHSGAVVSLSGRARGHSHPFVNGPLGACFDHLKGPRKALGHSKRSDLQWPRPEDWWHV